MDILQYVKIVLLCYYVSVCMFFWGCFALGALHHKYINMYTYFLDLLLNLAFVYCILIVIRLAQLAGRPHKLT